MVELFTTTYPKNMINMSFDRHFEVLSTKVLSQNLEAYSQRFEFLKLMDSDPLGIHEKYNFHRILSNFDCISIQERNLP